MASSPPWASPSCSRWPSIARCARPAGTTAGRAEPDLRQLLDLVALGTICDVVPLTGVNRALVTQGLKIMAARGNIGLAALADVARLNEAPGTYHAGFLLGPRVNAGGTRRCRRSRARACSRPTIAQEAAAIARQLDAYNTRAQADRGGRAGRGHRAGGIEAGTGPRAGEFAAAGIPA